MKKFTVKKSRRLVLFTWLETIIAGAIVVLCTNPIIWYGIVVSVLIALHAIINFWKKSEYIPVKWDSIVPAVFLPTAFSTFIIALIIAANHDTVLNSWTLGVGTVCIVNILLVYPESWYSGWD